MTRWSDHHWHALAPAKAFDASDALMIQMTRARLAKDGGPVAVGLCGAQGSGKSTTAARLARSLRAGGLCVATLSIDDFYLTRVERQDLARRVHPLFATRGVPGTHDVAFARRTVEALLDPATADGVPLPMFDKTRDDRVPAVQWTRQAGRPDVVIFEGWCVGARPQPDEALEVAVNDLERIEDADRNWRGAVNHALKTQYRDLFALLNFRIMLRAPDFEYVYCWRAEQEWGLRRNASSSAPMSHAELRRFISHYERLTRWIIMDEPAELIIDLNEGRVPRAYRERALSGVSSDFVR